MHETLIKTNLEQLKNQSKVNLERALQLQTRLGGHLVSGHIDGTGKISSIRTVGIANICEITASEDIINYLLPKGSVAIDGISLTVVDVGQDRFTVSLIPHTFGHTTLGFKGIGATVNLETDLIGKYVARFLKPGTKSMNKDISIDFLTEYGFTD
jgi:riboflavin synthase